jgi:hypothetical protein
MVETSAHYEQPDPNWDYATLSCYLWLNQKYYEEKQIWLSEARQDDEPVRFLADKISQLIEDTRPNMVSINYIHDVLLSNALEQIDITDIARKELEK